MPQAAQFIYLYVWRPFCSPGRLGTEMAVVLLEVIVAGLAVACHAHPSLQHSGPVGRAMVALLFLGILLLMLRQMFQLGAALALIRLGRRISAAPSGQSRSALELDEELEGGSSVNRLVDGQKSFDSRQFLEDVSAAAEGCAQMKPETSRCPATPLCAPCSWCKAR